MTLSEPSIVILGVLLLGLIIVNHPVELVETRPIVPDDGIIGELADHGVLIS